MMQIGSHAKVMSLLIAVFAVSMVTVDSLPYGILFPYAYGVQDPLESPRQMRDLSMGDLILTDHQKRAWKFGLSMSSLTRNGRINNFRWPNATIPYEIDCSLKNMPGAIEAIQNAMDQWKRKTCIEFTKRVAEKDYLRFVRDSHCWSNVGNIGGVSRISVGYGCEYPNTLAHMIGHILGLWHQHNRMDRDKYIRIFWQNIDSYTRIGFRRVEDAETLSGPYDYSSIMHYPWDAFSNSGRRTMLPLQKVENEPFKEISDQDTLKVSNLYGCFLKDMDIQILSHRLRRSVSYSSASRKDCRDRNTRCSEWASAGFCRRNRYVMENCKTSCKSSCGVQRGQGHGKCRDSYQSCSVWSTAGFCTRPNIAKACKLSCDSSCRPKGKCKDIGSFCKTSAAEGKCSNLWIRKSCSLSCDPKCGAKQLKRLTKPECRNRYAFCKRWALLGYCQKFSRARKLCSGSCKPECKKALTTPIPTTKPSISSTRKAVKVRVVPFISKTGRSVEYGNGVLCVDRNVRCDISKCKDDAWTNDNCKETCKQTECDAFIPKPQGYCSEPLGLSFNEGPIRLPDSAFSSSSHFKSSDWTAGPENARLYFMDDNKSRKIGAWCASIFHKGNSSWLQVNLGQLRTIFFIATQGRDKHYERVEKYKVSYSYDGHSFTMYKEGESVRTFDGNCDHFTPVMNEFLMPIKARYIRIHPVKFNFPCLRMELYGC